MLGVEPLEAYMFIFYYAVLSEVSPPTALSAFAAAAIKGGNACKTMITDNGEGLLLQGSVSTVALALTASAFAVMGLAVAAGACFQG